VVGGGEAAGDVAGAVEGRESIAVHLEDEVTTFGQVTSDGFEALLSQ
jgi:hypothetical protein